MNLFLDAAPACVGDRSGRADRLWSRHLAGSHVLMRWVRRISFRSRLHFIPIFSFHPGRSQTNILYRRHQFTPFVVDFMIIIVITLLAFYTQSKIKDSPHVISINPQADQCCGENIRKAVNSLVPETRSLCSLFSPFDSMM